MFCCFVFGAAAQDYISPKNAREDLTVMYNSLSKVHPGLYRYQDSSTFYHLYREIYDSFEGNVSYDVFFRQLARFNAAVKDLHTGIQHSNSVSKERTKVLPFVAKEIEDRIVVQYNASDDTTLNRGTELIEIAGTPVPDIIRQIKPLIGTDNDNPLAKSYYAVKALHNYYPRFFALGDTVDVKGRIFGTDSLVTFRLATMDKNELTPKILKRYPDKKRKNLSYVLEDSLTRLGRLDIHSFVQKGSLFDLFQMGFKRKLKRDFKAIKKDSVRYLALDLRGNGGGYIPNVSRLMRYLSKEPFRMMDTMAFRREAYFKIFPPYRMLPPLAAPAYFNKKNEHYRYRSFAKAHWRKPRSKWAYDGELLVLMDAGSYSATVFTLALLNTMNRASFIGTIPGGTTWGSHAGSWYKKTLPHSKIRIRIPQFRIVHSQWGKKETDLFLKPDYEVNENMEDFILDKDPYMETLKSLIQEKPSPEMK